MPLHTNSCRAFPAARVLRGSRDLANRVVSRVLWLPLRDSFKGSIRVL